MQHTVPTQSTHVIRQFRLRDRCAQGGTWQDPSAILAKGARTLRVVYVWLRCIIMLFELEIAFNFPSGAFTLRQVHRGALTTAH